MVNPHPRPAQRTLELLSALSYRTGELSQYLHEIACGVSDLIGLDWSVVTFCQDDSERVLASSIDIGEAANQVYSLHGNLTGTVFKRGCPLVVEDATICRDYGEAPEGYRAYLGVPLRTPDGRVIGTICSFQHEARQFTAEEVQLVSLFAERAATAIDNYQLYQQQQEINAQLQAEIQERQQVQAALQESETKFRRIVENANDIIYALTPEGIFTYLSPNMQTRTGYLLAEIVGQHFAPFIHPEDIEKCWAGFQAVVNTGQTQSEIEYRVHHQDGCWHWYLASLAVSQNAQGTMEIVGVARDVTDRKRAEAALRESEEKFRQLADNIEQVFWINTPEGQPIYVSPAFETIWGLPCDRWFADPDIWLKVIHPDDRDRVWAAYQDGQTSKMDEEYRIIRPDGSVRIIHDQAFPVRNQAGVIYRIAGIAEDITERKQSEQQMLKAVAALAEVGELTAMIVHELRNPLTTVLMGLTSLSRLDLPAPVRERLVLSLDEAERLKNLLSEILLYAKPQAIQPVALELNQFITEILEPVRCLPSAMSRRIEFTPSPEPIQIFADQDKLKQVFINLIDNACQAIGEGETVTWGVDPQITATHVTVRLQNGGDPIPPGVLPKLTKPFYTTKASGTGLGLAIVKRIVDAHSGDLTITSNPTEGTTVHLQLLLANYSGQ